MKRKLGIILLCVLFLLSTVGCGGNISTDTSASTSETLYQEAAATKCQKATVTEEDAAQNIQKERVCCVPFSVQDCIGMPIADLRKALADAGFTEIQATPKNIEATEGVPENRSVISISIDNDDAFESGDSFESTAIVRLTYAWIIEPTPTPTPSPTPTPTPTPDPTPTPTEQQPVEAMVWIPQNGKRYHSNPNCSNMKNPSQVTISQAQARGYTPCQKCY